MKTKEEEIQIFAERVFKDVFSLFKGERIGECEIKLLKLHQWNDVNPKDLRDVWSVVFRSYIGNRPQHCFSLDIDARTLVPLTSWVFSIEPGNFESTCCSDPNEIVLNEQGKYEAGRSFCLKGSRCFQIHGGAGYPTEEERGRKLSFDFIGELIKKTTSVDFRHFESSAAIELPEKLKTFYLTGVGGPCFPNTHWADESGGKEKLVITEFYHFDSSEPEGNILKWYSFLKDNSSYKFEGDYLPFASGEDSTHFAIGLKGELKGKVVHIDWNSSEAFPHIVQIRECFNDFIDNIW